MTVLVPYQFVGQQGNINANELDSDFNVLLPSILGYANAQALTTLTAKQFYLTGYSTLNDGGQGVFVYDSSDTTTADNGGTVLVDASGHRWKRLFSGPVNVRWFGAGLGGDDTAKINAALALGLSLYYPKCSVTCAGQVVVQTSGQSWIGEGKGVSNFTSTYAGGPGIVIGSLSGTPTQTQEISIHGMTLYGQAGQYLIWTRYVRAFRMFACRVVADGFLRLGDASLGNTKPTYVVELYDGNELNHMSSPTLHFVVAENFLGQWVSQNTFCEGQKAAGIHGFYAAGNLVDLEQGIVEGGYWSRFDVNWNFKNGRPSGWFFADHYTEGALTNAFLFETDGGQPDEGWALIHIHDCVVDANGVAIVFRCTNSGGGGTAVHIHDIEVSGTSSPSGGAILLDMQNGQISYSQIHNISGRIRPSTNTVDFVDIKGSDSVQSIVAMQIGNVCGISLSDGTKYLNSVVRIRGTQNALVQQTGQATGQNNLHFVIDDTGAASRNPSAIYRSSPGGINFGAIVAGASASTTVSLTGTDTTALISGSPLSSTPAGAIFTYACLASGVITITCTNASTGSITVNGVTFSLTASNFN